MRSYWKMLPLEHMMEVLNDTELPDERRDWAASQAAPYVHPRLSAIDLRQVEPPPRYALDLSKLTDEDLIELRRITAKAQVPLIEHRRARPEPIDVTPKAEDD